MGIRYSESHVTADWTQDFRPYIIVLIMIYMELMFLPIYILIFE